MNKTDPPIGPCLRSSALGFDTTPERFVGTNGRKSIKPNANGKPCAKQDFISCKLILIRNASVIGCCFACRYASSDGRLLYFEISYGQTDSRQVPSSSRDSIAPVKLQPLSLKFLSLPLLSLTRAL